MYYYPTISFNPTLFEGHSLNGDAAGGLLLVTFLLVLAFKPNVQDLLAV